MAAYERPPVRAAGEAGQALIEFAFVAPIMLVFLLGLRQRSRAGSSPARSRMRGKG